MKYVIGAILLILAWNYFKEVMDAKKENEENEASGAGTEASGSSGKWYDKRGPSIGQPRKGAITVNHNSHPAPIMVKIPNATINTQTQTKSR